MKRMIRTHYIYIIALLMVGCKAFEPNQQSATSQLPEKYLTDTDSTSIAALSWQEYFGDTILVGLIEEALTNNFDAQIALQRIVQARSSVIFNKGLLLPTVSAGGAGAMRRYGLYTMDGAGNVTTEIQPGQIVPVNLPDFLVGLQASWEADITGKLRNGKKASIARYLSSVEGKNWLLTNLIAEVAAAYYSLLALDQELEIIRSTISLQENALEIVTIQKQHGASNELAVSQFQAQVLKTKSFEFEILQQITETESMINSLLGRFPQPVKRSSLSDRNIASQMNVGIPSDLLRNRQDIKQAELELIASKADLKAARAAFYPSLNITGGIGFQAFKTSLLFKNPESFVFSLVGGLWAPLLNRSAIKAEFKSANAYQIEALYNYHKTVLLSYTEVYNELNNFNNLQQISEQKNEEVSVLTRSIETSTELYKTGRANYLEVLLTQQNTFNAKLDLVNTQKRQLISTLSLYKALGGGWK